MTIYLDIVLIENLCMNYIILFATGFIMKIKRKHIRLILSGLIGGLYSILAYMNILLMYSTMWMKVILSIGMTYIAFSPKTIKLLLKELVMFYLVSFVFGGCAFALLYFVKPQDIFMKDGIYIGTYPIKIALLAGIVGFVVIHIAFKFVKNKMSKKELIYDVEIKIEEKVLKLKAMLDTGNMLKDPITGVPVIVVEKEKLKEILPQEIVNNTDNIIGGDWNINEDNYNYRARFRIIPFTSIGKQNGMLLGFKVDEIKILTDVEEIKRKEAIICIYKEKLTKNNIYSALIGLDIFEGSDDKNEYFANIKV